MEYRVSVIIPVYKSKAYIERCARSLFEQSMKSIEFLFIDDCDPEESGQMVERILEDYPERRADVRILRNRINKGASYSRNVGLNISNGQYIAFCDSDDWMDKETIGDMYKNITDQRVDILWTDFYYAYSNKNVRSNQMVVATKDACIRALLQEKMHGGLWNKMYNRKLFIDYGIKFPEGRDMWEDLYTNIRLFFAADKLAYSSQACYYYDQENHQSLGKESGLKRLSEILQNTDSIIEFLATQNGNYHKEINILKLAAKQTLLFSTQLKEFKRWVGIFPESNSAIIDFKALPVHLRFVGWAASHRLWVIVQCWITLKGIKNRL